MLLQVVNKALVNEYFYVIYGGSFDRTGGRFRMKRGTEGFYHTATCFRFDPHCQWQELHESMRLHEGMLLMSPFPPILRLQPTSLAETNLAGALQ